MPLLGGDFGPRENNIVQTTATAAGGMSNVFVSAFPALYQLGLMRTPAEDFWRITTLTAVGGYLGFFFATPCMFLLFKSMQVSINLTGPSAQVLHHPCGEGAESHFPFKLCYCDNDQKYALCCGRKVLRCSSEG